MNPIEFGVDVSEAVSFGQKTVRWIKRWWHTYGPAGTDRLIRLQPMGATLKIREPDGGSIEFQFRLLNLTRRTVQTEDLQVRNVSVGRGGITTPDVFFRGRGAKVAPRQSGYFSSTIRLKSKDIRNVLHALKKSNNRYSTARTKVTARGQLKIKIGPDEEWRQFEMQVEQAHRSIRSPEEMGFEL